MTPVSTVRCVRASVATWHPPVEPGHDFCPPCLAWLRGDEPVDPLTQTPPAERRSGWHGGRYPPTGEAEEVWHEYLEAALAACS